MTEPTNPAEKESTGKLETNRRWIIAAVAAVVVAIIAGAVVIKSANSTDQEKVDKALTKLDLGTRGIELDKEIGRVASSDLSKKKALSRAAILEAEAVALREEAKEVDEAEQIVAGTTDAINAINDLSRVARGIQRSSRAINTSSEENIKRLRVTRKLLSRFQNASLGRLLSSSLTSYKSAIQDSIDELKEEDSLPGEDSDVPDPADSIEQIDKLKKELEGASQVPKDQIAKQIEKIKEKERVLLTKPAGTTCGYTSRGNLVVISEGEGVCSELIAAAEKLKVATGLGVQNGPQGWTCGLNPKTPSGNVGDLAQGVGCSNGSVTFSIFGSESIIGDIDAQASAAANQVATEGDSSCPEGSFEPNDWREGCVYPELGPEEGPAG